MGEEAGKYRKVRGVWSLRWRTQESKRSLHRHCPLPVREEGIGS